jgi:hypothetical protein
MSCGQCGGTLYGAWQEYATRCEQEHIFDQIQICENLRFHSNCVKQHKLFMRNYYNSSRIFPGLPASNQLEKSRSDTIKIIDAIQIKQLIPPLIEVIVEYFFGNVEPNHYFYMNKINEYYDDVTWFTKFKRPLGAKRARSCHWQRVSMNKLFRFLFYKGNLFGFGTNHASILLPEREKEEWDILFQKSFPINEFGKMSFDQCRYKLNLQKNVVHFLEKREEDKEKDITLLQFQMFQNFLWILEKIREKKRKQSVRIIIYSFDEKYNFPRFCGSYILWTDTSSVRLGTTDGCFQVFQDPIETAKKKNIYLIFILRYYQSNVLKHLTQIFSFYPL